MKKHLVLILSILSFYTQAQQNVAVGGGMGFNSYVGELNEGRVISYINNWEPIIAAEGSFIPYEYLGINAQLFYGKLYGNDALSSQESMNRRNFSFRSEIFGASLKVQGQLSDVSKENSSPFTIYFTGGIEYFHHNPSTYYAGERYFLRDLGTGGQGIEGYDDKYSLWALSLPSGGGLKIRVADNLVLKLEMLYHKTFTDYLDDVGGDPFLPYETLAENNGELAALLSDRSWEYLDVEPTSITRSGSRGSPGTKDGFISGMISIRYYLPTDNRRF